MQLIKECVRFETEALALGADAYERDLLLGEPEQVRDLLIGESLELALRLDARPIALSHRIAATHLDVRALLEHQVLESIDHLARHAVGHPRLRPSGGE